MYCSTRDVYTITLYWMNKDIGPRYFYITVNARDRKISKNRIDHKINAGILLPAESLEEVMTASEGTIRKYCLLESYERVSINPAHYVISPVHRLLKDIRKNKGPVSLEALAIPERF